MTEFTTWRSLVDGEEIIAIPDTWIDNFNNDDDPEQAGLYNGQTLSDFYSGDVSGFGRSFGDGLIGDHALEVTTDFSGMFSQPQDGLNQYPEEGDKIPVYLKDPMEADVAFMFNLDDSSTPVGYGVRLNDNRFHIMKGEYDSNSGAGDTQESSGQVIDPMSDWHLFEIDPPTSENDELAITAFTVDQEDGERIEQLEIISINDSDFVGNRAIGYNIYGDGSGVGWEFPHII